MRKTSNEYIAYLKTKKNISKSTESAYRKDLDKLIEFMNLYRIFDYEIINATNLNSYILNMELKGMSSATITRNITVIKGYFDYLFRTHRIPECITEDIKRPVHKASPRQMVNNEDLQKLMKVLESGQVKNQRDITMIQLMFFVKIPVSELIAIQLEDVNLELGFIRVTGSRGKEKMYGISDEISQNIDLYIKESRLNILKEESTILFPNMQGNTMSRQGVWKMVKTHARACGIEDINLSRLCKGDGN